MAEVSIVYPAEYPRNRNLAMTRMTTPQLTPMFCSVNRDRPCQFAGKTANSLVILVRPTPPKADSQDARVSAAVEACSRGMGGVLEGAGVTKVSTG